MSAAIDDWPVNREVMYLFVNAFRDPEYICTHIIYIHVFESIYSSLYYILKDILCLIH